MLLRSILTSESQPHRVVIRFADGPFIPLVAARVERRHRVIRLGYIKHVRRIQEETQIGSEMDTVN